MFLAKLKAKWIKSTIHILLYFIFGEQWFRLTLTRTMMQPATGEMRAPTATNQKSAGEPNMQRGARQQATINIQ